MHEKKDKKKISSASEKISDFELVKLLHERKNP